MARSARPWYREQTRWYMAQIQGKQVKLVQGDKNRDNKKLASAKLKELLQLAAKNPSVESKRQTVASVIEQYLVHAQATCCFDAYYQRQLYLQRFAEAHGWREVNDDQCKPSHLEQWVLGQADFKSDWTKAHAVKIVHSAFNYAVKNRVITANPFRGYSHRTGARRRPLTDAEFQALLRVTSVWTKRPRSPHPFPCERKRRQRPSSGARYRQLLVFLRFTGARPGEACGLKWTDIDLENGFIELREHKTLHSQAEPRPRFIPLHPVVLSLLIHIRQRQEPGQFVFLNHRKTPWNRRTLSTRIRRARSIAGIPADAKLYGLRHGFATRCILNGVHIKTLSELLGHTTTRMAEHYVHLAGQRAHLAAATLQANARRPAG